MNSKTTTLLLIFLCLSIDRDQWNRSIQSRISYKLSQGRYIYIYYTCKHNNQICSPRSCKKSPSPLLRFIHSNDPFLDARNPWKYEITRSSIEKRRPRHVVLFTSPIFISPLTSKPGLLFFSLLSGRPNAQRRAEERDGGPR